MTSLPYLNDFLGDVKALHNVLAGQEQLHRHLCPGVPTAEESDWLGGLSGPAP